MIEPDELELRIRFQSQLTIFKKSYHKDAFLSGAERVADLKRDFVLKGRPVLSAPEFDFVTSFGVSHENFFGFGDFGLFEDSNQILGTQVLLNDQPSRQDERQDQEEGKDRG